MLFKKIDNKAIAENAKRGKKADRLKYRTMIPNDLPQWLESLRNEITESCIGTQFSKESLSVIQYVIDRRVLRLLCRRVIRSLIETEIREDEGKQVLFIKRNGRVLLTFYVE